MHVFISQNHAKRQKLAVLLYTCFLFYEQQPFKVGIVGATGAVGEEIVGCLKKRGFEVSELKLFASARSAGKVKETPMGEVTIEEFSLDAVSEGNRETPFFLLVFAF